MNNVNQEIKPLSSEQVEELEKRKEELEKRKEELKGMDKNTKKAEKKEGKETSETTINKKISAITKQINADKALKKVMNKEREKKLKVVNKEFNDLTDDIIGLTKQILNKRRNLAIDEITKTQEHNISKWLKYSEEKKEDLIMKYTVNWENKALRKKYNIEDWDKYTNETKEDLVMMYPRNWGNKLIIRWKNVIENLKLDLEDVNERREEIENTEFFELLKPYHEELIEQSSGLLSFNEEFDQVYNSVISMYNEIKDTVMINTINEPLEDTTKIIKELDHYEKPI